MSLAVNFAKLVKLIPLHSLMGGSALTWVTGAGLNWITASGSAWGTGGHRHVAWLRALVAPIQSLNTRFVDWSDDVLYRLHITGQVVYLELYLNDLYDSIERRIYIEDDTPVLAPFIFQKAEESPLYLHRKGEDTPLYLYSRYEYSSQYDFIVFVPASLDNTLGRQRLRAAVNRYRQAGAKFTIKPIQ